MHYPSLASDIMVTNLLTLGPETHVCDGLAQLLRKGISGAPIIDEQGTYLGVFSEKCCMSMLMLAAQLAANEESSPPRLSQSKDFMATGLVTLSPDMDIVDAIGLLLKHHISGAPVLDSSGRFLGVLSERYSMRFLIDAAYEQLPTSQVGPFMNTDFGRVVAEDADLIDVASIFLTKYYRRLVVLQDGILLGQISRRDVLRAGQQLADMLRTRDHALLDHGDRIERSDETGSAPLQRPGSLDVRAFMDTRAQTITEDMDLLGISQIFLNTNYRRLPVLRDGKLVGQVSRRDVLQATYDVMAVVPQRESTLLYLSSLLDRSRAPIPR